LKSRADFIGGGLPDIKRSNGSRPRFRLFNNFSSDKNNVGTIMTINTYGTNKTSMGTNKNDKIIGRYFSIRNYAIAPYALAHNF